MRAFDLSEPSGDGEEKPPAQGGWGYRKGVPILLANPKALYLNSVETLTPSVTGYPGPEG